jgi:predicted metal-binding membrane protein
MNTPTLVTIVVIVSISLLTWLVSIWQYDAMMLSMMTFYQNLATLSLFMVIWTASMAAMMFPAIVPTILVFNRLINMDNAIRNNPSNSSTNSQMAYRRSSTDGRGYAAEKSEGDNSSSIIHRLLNTLQSKPPDIILFVSAYLAIWAITGVILLVGWSFIFDTLLPPQLGQNESQQSQLVSTNIIYGIVLIVAGVYQFSSLKSRWLGYCEFPLSYLMRRLQKGRVGALKMGMYHGLYCLGCCWPYFLLMVALGWMNIFWMGLFSAIIFAEKNWIKGGLWVARITGICFIALGILSSTGAVSLPSDPMSDSSGSSSSGDSDMTMTMMSSGTSSSSPYID